MFSKLIKLAIKLHNNGNTQAAIKIANFSMPFLRENYDYGEGFYQNLDKYKSVEDFLKKRRKKKSKNPKTT